MAAGVHAQLQRGEVHEEAFHDCIDQPEGGAFDRRPAVMQTCTPCHEVQAGMMGLAMSLTTALQRRACDWPVLDV